MGDAGCVLQLPTYQKSLTVQHNQLIRHIRDDGLLKGLVICRRCPGNADAGSGGNYLHDLGNLTN